MEAYIVDITVPDSTDEPTITFVQALLTDLAEDQILVWDGSKWVNMDPTAAAITAAQVKTLYESNADTNAFTDTEKAKLAGVEDNATADQTGAEIKTAYEAEANTNAFTDTEKAKLAGVEDNATADQTGAEIKTAYEAQANTNAYTDDEKSKLAAIEANADVTDSVNVDAAGATMNSDTNVSGNSWVTDEDDMASNSDQKVPTEQSVKAYVDAGLAGKVDKNNSFNAQTGTNYTLVLGDKSKVVTCSNAGAITLTVPPNSSVAFEVGAEITVLQKGDGQITITPGAGVTLNSADGNLKSRVKYSAVTLIKESTDVWYVIGDLSA